MYSDKGISSKYLYTWLPTFPSLCDHNSSTPLFQFQIQRAFYCYISGNARHIVKNSSDYCFTELEFTYL